MTIHKQALKDLVKELNANYGKVEVDSFEQLSKEDQKYFADKLKECFEGQWILTKDCDNLEHWDTLTLVTEGVKVEIHHVIESSEYILFIENIDSESSEVMIDDVRVEGAFGYDPVLIYVRDMLK